MREFFSAEKMDYMINNKFFNYFIVPIMASLCLFLSVLFYGVIDKSFTITDFQNDAGGDFVRYFSLLIIDGSVKFAISTLFFFFIYILFSLVAVFFISKKIKLNQ